MVSNLIKQRKTTETKLQAAFQGHRNRNFSLKSCKLYTTGLLRSAEIPGLIKKNKSGTIT